MNAETDTKQSISTDLVKVQTALTEFDKISAGLEELRGKYHQVVFPVDTAAGMVIAKQARQEIRAPRYATEQARKSAKAPIIALGKNIDERARYIEQALTDLEDPIHQQIQSEEKRKEDERAARAAAEQDRLARIQANIRALQDFAVQAAGATSVQIAHLMEELESETITKAMFFEFQDIAEAAKVATRNKLAEMFATARTSEQAAAALKQQQEELARRQAEQDERERQERARLEQEAAQREAEDKARRDAIAAEEAAAKARIEAQERAAAAEREAADLAARQARQAEEQAARAIREEEQAKLRAEADRLAKERLAKEERDRKAQAEKDAKAKAKAEKEEAARQKALYKEQERMDARQLLQTFSGRYADVAEFNDVMVAIDAYFQAFPIQVAA